MSTSNEATTSTIGIGVNVALVKDGQLLLGRRIGKRGYGTWCLPGGHLEYGENLREAAARELKEETGIIARPDIWNCCSS